MSNQYLIYSKQGCITGELIADSLGITASKNIFNYPPLIRWGNSFNPFSKDTDYNNPHFIRITSNKLRTYEMLSSNNINCVEYKKGIPDSYPVLIRTLLEASKGKGIIIVNNEDEYDPEYQSYYHSPFINFSNEYRLHVLGGNIVKVMEKVPHKDNTIVKNNESCNMIRKDINIMRFRKPILEIVEQLYSNFPMKIMAIDLGISEGVPYIIEINSAPGLNSLTLQIYVEFLRKELCL